MMQAGAGPQREEQIFFDPPRLLVAWEPRWQGFKSAIVPALARPTRPLAGEIVSGARPGRGGIASLVIHCAMLFLVTGITTRVLHEQALLQHPAEEQRQSGILYYSGNELPQVTGDAGGAQAGTAGRSGGREAFHPTQVIKVTRGDRTAELVADISRLKLPKNSGAVANLVAMQAGALPSVPVEAIRSTRSIKLNVPVVAPAPQAQDMHSRTPQWIATEVVAPAADAAEITSLRKSPRLTPDVAPPPVSAPMRDVKSLARITLPAAVVQPATEISEIPVRGARIVSAQKTVAGPPVDVAETGVNRRTSSLVGRGTAAVPPMVELGPDMLGGAPGGRGNTALALASGGTTVVGPPADIGPDSVGQRDGRGTAVAGLYSPSAGTPGGAGVTGVVVSANPGSGFGAPDGAGDGSLAMSPRGSGVTGLGGSGSGHSIGNGSGTGSGARGVGPGAAPAGTGHGVDAHATSGIGVSGGPGGSGVSGGGLMSGITVTGGGTVYNIPSFNGGPAPTPDSIRMADKGRQIPNVTVVASARSGSALHQYGVLKGSRVYTIYIDTAMGTAVMEFSEHQQSAGGSFEAGLIAPEPMRSDVPANLPKMRIMISCVIDRSGTLRNLRVMNSHDTSAEKQLLAALGSWHFRPVIKGNDAVEVDAIVGFGIDTH